MRGKIIAVANMKGGVGKTTTVVMLAEALAATESRNGKRLNKVLVLDVDAQSSASYCIAGDETFALMVTKGQTIDAYVQDRLLRGRKVGLSAYARSHVCETSFKGDNLGVELIACGIGLRRREREIYVALNREGFELDAIERCVWDAVSPDLDALRASYDYIILDCAPGMSLMTDIAVRFADIVLATCMPDHLSLRGLETFIQTTWLDPSGLPTPRKIPYVLVTRFQQNIRQHKQTIAKLEEEAAQDDRHWHIMSTRVPVSAHLAETLEPKDEFPTLAGRYKDLVASLLTPLVTELEGHLHGH